MQLVKFCKSEHNLLKGCNSIRFGTPEYYRNLDSKFLIGDPDEGVDSHLVEHPGDIPTDREAQEFLRSTGFITPDMFIQGINFRRTFPNCYIWCCKMVEKEPNRDDGKEFDAGYDSFYTISDPVAFYRCLGALLIQKIKRQNFSDQGKQFLDHLSIAELKNINLICFHGPVDYVERKHGSIVFGRSESYTQKIPLALRPLFVKPSKYAANSEYRFAFMFHYQPTDTLIPVAADPVDAKAIPIS